MKKITKVVALLAASALLFGGLFLSCSDSDDDGNTTPVSEPSSNSGSGNSGSDNSGGSGNQEGGNEEDDSTAYPNSLVYNFDDLTSVPTTEVGDNSILDGNVIYWVAANKTGNAKVTANEAGTHHYLQVSAGGAIDSSLTTVDLSNQTTLLKLKAAQAGKEQIVFTFTTVKGGTDSNNRILVVDPTSGTVLGQTSEVSCGTSDDNTEKTLSVKAEVPETFYLVFARSAGKGGFKFTKIEQKYRQESGSGSGSEGGSTGGSSEQGSTVTADWVAGANKYSDGTLTGTNCTWTWATDGATMNDKDNYIVQIGKGSTNKNVATLNVKGACKVTVTFRYGGDHDASKIRDLDIGGVNKPMDSSTDKAKDYTVEYTATVAGDIAVKGNGVNIKEIKVE